MWLRAILQYNVERDERPKPIFIDYFFFFFPLLFFLFEKGFIDGNNLVFERKTHQIAWKYGFFGLSANIFYSRLVAYGLCFVLKCFGIFYNAFLLAHCAQRAHFIVLPIVLKNRLFWRFLFILFSIFSFFFIYFFFIYLFMFIVVIVHFLIVVVAVPSSTIFSLYALWFSSFSVSMLL